MTVTACPVCRGTGEVEVVLTTTLSRRDKCPMCEGTGLLSPDNGSSPAGSHVERRPR